MNHMNRIDNAIANTSNGMESRFMIVMSRRLYSFATLPMSWRGSIFVYPSGLPMTSEPLGVRAAECALK